MKGYKVFNPDFTCKGMQYKENEVFEVDLPIKICEKGIHFCQKASLCFTYYSFDPNNIVCEVEALGDFETHTEDSKVCTNKLRVIRRLTWQEVLVAANEGANNTGHSNTGDRNSGYRNSGSSNSGSRNSGDSNSGYRNPGAFCVDENPVIWLFDKPTKIKVKDWENSDVIRTMNDLLELTIWIPSGAMTEKEKQTNPKWETTEGYLKTKTIHEAWADMWGNLDKKRKKLFTDLPNFDAKKFKTITGIEV